MDGHWQVRLRAAEAMAKLGEAIEKTDPGSQLLGLVVQTSETMKHGGKKSGQHVNLPGCIVYIDIYIYIIIYIHIQCVFFGCNSFFLR